MAWHSNTTICWKLDNKCVLSMSTSLNVTSASAVLPLWSDCPPHPSSMGAEPTVLQATWREQASTKNFLRDVLCCNSRVAVTRLLRMLCRQPMKHSAKKSCASLASERDTHTHKCRCARELKKLTATQNRTINFQFIVDQRQTVRDMTVCLHHLTKPQALGNDSKWSE